MISIPLRLVRTPGNITMLVRSQELTCVDEHSVEIGEDPRDPREHTYAGEKPGADLC